MNKASRKQVRALEEEIAELEYEMRGKLMEKNYEIAQNFGITIKKLKIQFGNSRIDKLGRRMTNYLSLPAFKNIKKECTKKIAIKKQRIEHIRFWGFTVK